MAFDKHLRRGVPIVLGLIIFFSIIELALSAFLTSQFNTNNNYFSLAQRDRVRFLLFTSIWSLVLSGAYMGWFFFGGEGVAGILGSVGSYIIFLALTWIFWTAGAASITDVLGGGLNCATQRVFVYCGQLNALEGFAWVIWIITTFAVIVALIRGVMAARSGDGIKAPLVD